MLLIGRQYRRRRLETEVRDGERHRTAAAPPAGHRPGVRRDPRRRPGDPLRADDVGRRDRRPRDRRPRGRRADPRSASSDSSRACPWSSSSRRIARSSGRWSASSRTRPSERRRRRRGRAAARVRAAPLVGALPVQRERPADRARRCSAARTSSSPRCRSGATSRPTRLAARQPPRTIRRASRLTRRNS